MRCEPELRIVIISECGYFFYCNTLFTGLIMDNIISVFRWYQYNINLCVQVEIIVSRDAE